MLYPRHNIAHDLEYVAMSNGDTKTFNVILLLNGLLKCFCLDRRCWTGNFIDHIKVHLNGCSFN